MRIDQIDLYHVAMPLVAPWRTAYGDDAVVESVLVRMVSGGLVGWGETSPLAGPTYSPEWAGGVFATLRRWLAPRIVGQDVLSAADLQQRLAIFKGNPFAKAGLDLAWWDLHARCQGQPLYRILGGTSPIVAVGADFGVQDSVEILLDKMATALAAGYPRVKLKFRPGWDLPMLRAVRQRFPAAAIHIDCNSGYRLEDARLFQSIDEFHLAMIEQPLAHDDLLDHAALQRQIKTPICLDESITSLDRARQALEVRACRYVNVKPGRVGGLTVALAIHDLCRGQGVPCWVGGMLESAIGAAHCLALATLPNFTYPNDIFPSCTYYREDLAEPPLELSGPGQMRPIEGPGIGTVPNPERLRRMTLEHAEVVP
ncbi:MAG: o-succinylbenzoate synthase [Gemmataceae bacterium]|nr:o-succinylbenzoate synthase [Gemmataceae bacterium]MDW8266953.1 o-succinylbenzoate synthase [Gemmataceae bacterium]